MVCMHVIRRKYIYSLNPESFEMPHTSHYPVSQANTHTNTLMSTLIGAASGSHNGTEWRKQTTGRNRGSRIRNSKGITPQTSGRR